MLITRRLKLLITRRLKRRMRLKRFTVLGDVMKRWMTTAITTMAAMLALSACDDDTSPSPSTAQDAEARPDAAIDAALPDMGCVPSTEICNAIDDDCDEAVDEGFDALAQPCAVQEGPCTSEGVFICDAEGGATLCDAPPPESSDELCDMLDNDCDGSTDEAFDLRVDESNCGACGRVCDLPNAASVCVDSDCGISDCNDGFRDANRDATDGCECVESNGGVELCDGLDNNCDGVIDEDFAVGVNCMVEQDACSSAGTTACDDMGAVVCDAPPIVTGDETCNGMDDDCDGAVDEDFDADDDGAPVCEIDCDAPCPDGVDCATVCANQDCAPDDASIFPGAREICEDGIDQNCDGRDRACIGTSGYISALAVANGAPASCRDFTGDGVPDNSFSPAGAFANGSIQDSINQGSLNLLPTTFGLGGDGDGAFDLAVLFGRSAGPLGTYSINPDSFDDVGDPRIFFLNAQLMGGAMVAGPGNFFFDLPVLGAQLMLDINDALITGDLALMNDDLTIANGWISGVIPRESFMTAIMLLDPALQDVVAGVIRPDVDTDADGEPDAYSVCLSYTTSPATIAE
ncbi:MAG: hypothetical protein ACI9U2_005060 [Bradymonadia bacterium]